MKWIYKERCKAFTVHRGKSQWNSSRQKSFLLQWTRTICVIINFLQCIELYKRRKAMTSGDTLKSELDKLQNYSFQCPLFQSLGNFFWQQNVGSVMFIVKQQYMIYNCASTIFSLMWKLRRKKLHSIIEGSGLFYQCMLF